MKEKYRRLLKNVQTPIPGCNKITAIGNHQTNVNKTKEEWKMYMIIFFYISTYLFFLSLLMKVIIHICLDDRNGYKIIASPVSNWIYLLPYDKEVQSEYGKKKRLCNKIQRISIVILCFTILSLIVKTFSWTRIIPSTMHPLMYRASSSITDRIFASSSPIQCPFYAMLIIYRSIN